MNEEKREYVDPENCPCSCDALNVVFAVRKDINGGGQNFFRVECCDCGRKGLNGTDHLHAIERWNNREYRKGTGR